ncbi:MAG: RNA polymerase sigma factor SigJ [Actinobacteria bacterium]|nr:RNA polymerase sigma factor SigJ [Actinomycetota bacterium]
MSADVDAVSAPGPGPPKGATVAATELFEANRGHVFGVAYRMLGSVAEAEDVVQDTWLRWRDVDASVIRSPRAYLGTVAGRIALDRLKSARAQREAYVGPWLPEPLVTDAATDPAAHADTADSLTFGFLCVLERLDPLERAVFLLREVFSYPYGEVAAVVGRSDAACRQIAHRARARVADEQRRAARRGTVDRAKAQQIVSALVAATVAGDVDGVQRLLAEQIVLVSDGGADTHAARRPVVGRHRVSRLIINLAARVPRGASVDPLWSNGDPAMLFRDASGAPLLLIAFTAGDATVEAIHAVVNPAKLAHLAR